MNFCRLRRYDTIEVIWNDAWTPGSKGWIHEHESGSLDFKTIAIFWEQNKKYIYTYGSVSLNEEFTVLKGNPFNIPKGCIKSIRVLK